MLTGAGGVKSATAAVGFGADGYIEKHDLSIGGDLTEFFYALEQALERRAGIVAKKQLEQIKTGFYSMMTHDLRNPAGVLDSSLKMLLSGVFGELTGAQREVLLNMQLAAAKLLGLVSDYLDYTKIDAGYLKLELTDGDLRGVVENSVGGARLQALAKKQTLDVALPSAPVMVRADEERMGHVLDNLLSNAIKYTPDGGRIQVELMDEPAQAVLRVSDTGNGIPQDQLASLFTKYHRVPGKATRGIHGTGLGLLIVKEIIDAHGGAVCAESDGVPGGLNDVLAREHKASCSG